MFDQPDHYGSIELKQANPPSLLEGLKQRQFRLRSDLAKIDDAIEALEKNPEIAAVIEKITKIRGL
jgi:hypothetical protein